jgi:anti-sigma factor RsiW
MTCQEAITFFLEYLEATLDDDRLARLEEHLAGCDPCVAYLNTYRRTRDVAGAEGRVEMPEAMTERLRAFLLAELRRTATET